MAQLSFINFTDGNVLFATDLNTPFTAVFNRINNGMETDNIADLAVTTAKIASNAVNAAKLDETDDFTWTGTHDFSGGTVSGINAAPTNYRQGLLCTQASSATITVSPGNIDVNGTQLTKSSNTTLTLTTDADWAGGSSLQATSTYGYVGIDASGNIKMHTTAPSHIEYDLSNTTGKKRYASWSSTTYRVIGWFYMNSTGSGELNAYEVGNIKEGDAPNSNGITGTTNDTINDVSYGSDLTETTLFFYSSGGPVSFWHSSNRTSGTSNTNMIINIDSSDITATEKLTTQSTEEIFNLIHMSYLSQGTHSIIVKAKVASGSVVIDNKVTMYTEN